jgi:N-methylhydantoinase A
MTTDFEIDWDMPIPIPLIEVLSIGAGGGSVAWIDPGGALKVGPKSAGAFPGPVCYGQGGVEPTVTDANLVLGYLDPKAFLSGDMKLDIEGAKEAISKLGEVLGLDMYQTAQGILEIVNQNMANAVKEITIGKGRDPRDFALSAFGGAGSLHAVSVSEKVGIPKVIVPLEPGNLCAFGDVNMNLQNEVGGFFYSKVQDVDIDALNKKFLEMDKEGEDSLDKQQVRCKAILTKHMISMRYVGQSYELEIPCPNSILQEQDITNLIADYHAEHKKIYFVADEESEVEITRLRATSVGIVMDPIDMEDLELVNKHSEDKSVMAMFDNSLLETKVFSRLNLLPGTKIAGPAIIRESKSSTVIPPGKACVVSKIDKSLIIEADKGGVYNG